MSNRHVVVHTGLLGDVTVVASGEAVVGVYFPHHWVRPGPAVLGDEVVGDPLLDEAARQLTEYLAGGRVTFDLPVAAEGDSFQLKVWAMLGEIPYGATTSYGEIAERLGDRSLAQSVGQAVGSNPLSVIVPCHRVVGRDGKLTGYAGGLKRKQALLDLEEPAEVRAARLF